MNPDVAVILDSVTPFTIHGQPNYELKYHLPGDPSRASSCRIGAEQIYANPQPGDRVRLKQVLGIVTGVEKEEGES